MRPLRYTRAAGVWMIFGTLALMIGALLRWYQLDIQVLVDDEWHALHKVLYSDTSHILTSFGSNDYSIPLTLYYKLLATHGGLTDWVMHLPMLVCGVALIIVAPWTLRNAFSAPVRATWVALLAISPLLIYHSRTARPYALTCLLTFIAIFEFRRWWKSPQPARAEGAVYVSATALAAWLHPVTLVFNLTPFLYCGVQSLVHEWRRRGPFAASADLRRLLLLGVCVVIPVALALGPPLLADPGALANKAGIHSVDLESLYRTALLLFGISSPIVLIGLLALVGWGVVLCWRSDRDLVGYLATIFLIALFTICAAKPIWISHPLVLARYMLPTVPLVLLFLARGMMAAVERIGPAFIRAVFAASAVGLLWWAGPVPGYLYFPNQFMGHYKYQYDYDSSKNPYVTLAHPDPIPEFYRRLGNRPPASVTLIEAPWRLESNFNPHPWYQEIHRQYVKIGLVTPTCGVRTYGEYPESSHSIRLRQFAHLSSILEGKTYGADYLVLHLHAWTIPPGAAIEWPDVAACLPLIEQQLGAALFSDEQIVVFRLKH